MTPKHLYLLSLALVAISAVAAQTDELQIPVENDNQFPPDTHSDGIDGSGDGAIEEPAETEATTTEAAPIPIEHIESKILLDDLGATTAASDDDLCPKPCVCRIEGVSNEFIVDCSGYDLTEFPTPISDKVTILNLQNNKLTEIPKEISSLKSLKVLNANDNSIMNFASGSISELPDLVTLKLGNNKLVEYPSDLKNGFGLTKLEELDLGGNDMRTVLSSETFSIFEALRKIVLPVSIRQLNQTLCDALPNLENVCTGSCDNQVFECKSSGENPEDLPVIPGMIQSISDNEDNTDPDEDEENETSPTESTPIATTKGYSFRSAVNKQPSDEAQNNAIVVAPNNAGTTEQSVEVGATKSETKTGGVDKSIIGLVVAGMVVIVAAITIKKNWSSIKKRFSSNSNSRTPTERNGTNANGAAPEEVPLQNKSPV